ncbi:MAG: galactose-1-phosphate uridylyltransferase [Caldisphaeraceae archaeon]|nr:galactose-1-phosphate uridylyltransferase [Caldisphaeraceae archaeon]MEB3691403.1 galactose-1-phosphate uridylyltransferase [Caldisphaeraceae archaeon]MEB3797636.1 galactose-1-phosphate uridylyltransferase [Caldisphaeraceae archaeon]
MRELRYNPLTGQWIIVSSVRKERRWRTEGYCPFCPGSEETGYGWNTLVLPNKYSALSFDAESVNNEGIYIKSRALGECGVIIETPDHNVKDLDELSNEALKEVISQWKMVTERYRSNKRIAYLMIFRNKGEEIGVSLFHPHGQYYAMPFIPLRIRNIVENSRRYYRRFNVCIFCQIINQEMASEKRVIYENNSFVLLMPFFSSWPYELHIYPKRHLQYLTQLNEKEVEDFADILKVALKILNKLFDRQMPYSFALIQAPFIGKYEEYFHMHLEIYPLLRDKDKIKYSAGIEMSTWDFTYDGVPEENARKMKDVCRRINSSFLGRCIG